MPFLIWLLGLLGLRRLGSSACVPPVTPIQGTDTEFSAEIVRVTQILPHPNADRLEIARFEMKGIGETTYEVVVQKGAYKTGDLAAYFSVDCVLPLSHPEFAFLKERADGKNKTHFRLRAAKLRGVFSQGLLVDSRGNPFGTQVANEYGVTYHRDPEPAEHGPTAASSKPKTQPMPIYGVESLKKVPRLFEVGEPVYVTEKIHGTNFRFGWVKRRGLLGLLGLYRFVVGSHRVVKGDGSAGYYGADVWSEAAIRMDLARKTKGYLGHVFYGELYGFTYDGKPIQDMHYNRNPGEGPGLVIFDIRCLKGNAWLLPDERNELCGAVGLTPVPMMGVYSYMGTDEYSADPVVLAEGLSYLACRSNASGYRLSNLPGNTPHIREGIVVESLEGPRRKAKYVSEAYLRRHENRSAAA